MSNVRLSFTVHYLSFMLFLGVLVADFSYLDMPSHHTYAGRLKFLTFISFLCDLIYFNLAAIIDFLIWTRGKDSPLWKKFRDFFFATVIFPVASFACVMFWVIYMTDSTSMRTAEEQERMPRWFDHGYHTLPILTVFFQAYIIEHSYPRKIMAFVSLFVVDFLYLCWLFWIAHKTKFWVYPFLSRMSSVGILVFLTASVIISFGFYFVGKKFTDVVWQKDSKKSP